MRVHSVYLQIENFGGKKIKMESVCSECVARDFTMPKQPRRITQNTLVDAVSNGHDKCVEALIKLGARVNRLNDKKLSPLMAAVQKGHETCTDLLMRAGADLNLTECVRGRAGSALHEAAATGQVKCLSKLIEAGVKVNLIGTGGLTALHLAAEKDHKEYFDKLVEAGANVNSAGKHGVTVLHKAAENRSKKCLERLIKLKAKVHQRDEAGKTALLKAAGMDVGKKSNSETETGMQSAAECIQILLKAGADVDAADNNWHTPLSRAAECGDQKAIEILLQNGAYINAMDASGNTPLIKAVKKKHVNCLVYLINQGADVNIANKHGMTPLVVASGICASAVVLMIDKGANVNAKTSSGNTPLYYFASNIHDNEFEIGKVCLDLLITAGADVNLGDGESGTALMSTVKYNHKKVFTYLLEKGADTNKVSRDNGRTAMHYAARYSKLEYMQSLIEHGAHVNVADDSGETPLIIVASYPKYTDARKTIDCIKLLLKMGALVNYLSNKGINAIGGLLPARLPHNEAKYEALKVLYAAGEMHENIIVDCNDKLIVLPSSNHHNPLDSGFAYAKSIFRMTDDLLPSKSATFKHDPNSQLDFCLKHFCREAVRKHLLQINMHENMFGVVPKLHLTSLMTEHLLYGVSLNF